MVQTSVRDGAGDIRAKGKMRKGGFSVPKRIRITHNGQTNTIHGWAKLLGIPASTVRERYMAGCPIDRPRRAMLLECRGEINTVRRWAEITGVDPNRIRARLRQGWTPEQALCTPGKYPTHRLRPRSPETLCWKCRNAVPNSQTGAGCEWSKGFCPVPGWTAELHECDGIESYRVLSCPKFERG